MRQTNHPDILRDVERCKADYYLQHPSAKAADLADFQDLSLVNVSRIPDPADVILLSSLLRRRRKAQLALDIVVCGG